MASAWATLIVYAFQMVVSYLLGQKFYPIQYNLRKFVLYLGLALVFFGTIKGLGIEDGWLQFIVNNSIIFIYVLVIYVLEKPKKKVTRVV
jgi:hypothetical protein